MKPGLSSKNGKEARSTPIQSRPVLWSVHIGMGSGLPAMAQGLPSLPTGKVAC